MQDAPIDNDTGAQAALRLDVHKVAQRFAARGQIPLLGERGEIGVVLKEEWPRQTASENRPDFNVKPAETFRSKDASRRLVNRARQRDSSSQDLTRLTSPGDVANLLLKRRLQR